MIKLKSLPKISVCIPVFNSEATLFRTLESLPPQTFTEWECIIVNDGSNGKDLYQNDCKKIVTRFRKKYKFPKNKILYIEHRKNLGLLEARRSAVFAASAQYICILDSDDELLPESLEFLYKAAQKSDADIVHGASEILYDKKNCSEEILLRASSIEKKANNIYEGELLNQKIFDGFLVKSNHSGFLWGKLFRRELYLKALSYIPFSNCVFAEDFLQYFFISLFAKKYTGIENNVYRYYIDSGISSLAKIEDLQKWQKISSTANVFTILFSVIKEFSPGTFSQNQMEALRSFSKSYLANNLKQLNEAVDEKIKTEARQMLCDYWGEDFVEYIEENTYLNPAREQQ